MMAYKRWAKAARRVVVSAVNPTFNLQVTIPSSKSCVFDVSRVGFAALTTTLRMTASGRRLPLGRSYRPNLKALEPAPLLFRIVFFVGRALA